MKRIIVNKSFERANISTGKIQTNIWINRGIPGWSRVKTMIHYSNFIDSVIPIKKRVEISPGSISSMITLKHLEIYLKYDGDGDDFVRYASANEKAFMKYEDWSLIESLLQDLNLVNKELASENFLKGINEKLKANCDHETTLQKLKSIAAE